MPTARHAVASEPLSPLYHVMDTAMLLRQIPVFSRLTDDAITRLAAACVERTVSAGTVLFTAGEESRGLYVVASGGVRIYQVSSEGREQVLHLEGPGQAVAELPLFDGGAYPASAITMEDSQLVFLPRAAFESVYMSDPESARVIIRALGQRLRHLVQVTETLAFRDVASRLALLLVRYAESGGQQTDAGLEIVLGRTREALAMEIGTARESVSRAFRQLQKKGLVLPASGKRLVIPDLQKLRTIAGPGARARP